MNKDTGKIYRILSIYKALADGKTISKKETAVQYHVNERTIQRDIGDIRSFLDYESREYGIADQIIYDRSQQGYRLERIKQQNLTPPEILAVCKILLDSRAFTKKTMSDLLDRLIECCSPEYQKKYITTLIRNEEFHYVELRHKKEVLDTMWEIGCAVKEHRYIEVEYDRLKERKTVRRRLMPLAVMFSEYYFYFAAFIDSDDGEITFNDYNSRFPTIYRIDRLKHITVLDDRYHIPYSSRFEEGEFRKRIQFMTGGELRKICFEYRGLSIESVLDRLPTARILSEEDGVYIVQAEVFGDGVDRWIRGQGEDIRLVSG